MGWLTSAPRWRRWWRSSPGRSTPGGRRTSTSTAACTCSACSTTPAVSSDVVAERPTLGAQHARNGGQMTQRLTVQRTIAAEPATIFEILATPSGHVAIDASGMLMSADGDRVTAVGDRFDVHMDRESLNDFPLGEYTVTVVIDRYEPDRAIAWTIDGVIQPPMGHVYGYEL